MEGRIPLMAYRAMPALARRLRRLLPLPAAMIIAGCAQQLALHLPDTGNGIRERVSVYDQLAYWPTREATADDGRLCLPESLLQTVEAGSGTHDDLWSRLRAGYGFDGDIDSRRVEHYLGSYAHKQRLFDSLENRASPYLHYVIGELEKREMPLELALLPIIESGYNPSAVSPGHAAGLWQIIPTTGSRFGLQQNGRYDGRKDVVASTRAALDYLEMLHQRFDGDWYLALAAYNTGEGNVQRAIERNRRLGKPTDYWSLPLSQQACNYVPRLIALSRVLEAPEKHGIELSPIPDTASWVPVEVRSRVDPGRVASYAGLDTHELLSVNPAFAGGSIPARRGYSVLVPASERESFVAALTELPAQPAVRSSNAGDRYRVRKGDTLSAIAQRNQTSVTVLRTLNGLANDRIREGQSLLLPENRAATRASMSLATMPNSNSPAQRVYTVRSGDTLSTIATRLGMRTAALASLNAIDERSTLRIGQRLRLHSDDTATSTAAQRYTVRAGDSITRIAERFGVSTRDMLAWNRIDPARPLIRPGQVLVLHVQPSLAHADQTP